MKRTIIIIGGVAGGATAAARLRRIDEQAEIILIERGKEISFANCGMPYYIGDVITNQNKLLLQTPESFKARFNIEVWNQKDVIKINRKEKTLEVRDLVTNQIKQQKYDKLILSPGAIPLRPPIPGIDHPKIFTLRNMADTFAIRKFIDNNHPEHAVVVGGGFIGLEMAENLVHRGVKVTIVEMLPQVMNPLDPEMAAFVHLHLKAKNVELYLSNGVKAFESLQEKILVHLQNGSTIQTDLALLGLGVKPERKLAEEAGLKIGPLGGIVVTNELQTSDPDIFAIGDAIEVTDFVNAQPALIPLAGPANRQGRIVADIFGGVHTQYIGTQGTSIVKVFDLTVATTGNNEKQLRKYGIPYQKSYTHSSSHATYYPGAVTLSLKLLFDPTTGKILGTQIVGGEGVDKRIDVIATAIRAKMTVYDLQNLELAYAPPYSSAKDPVNIAGYVAGNILSHNMEVIHWHELKELNLEKTIILDVRTPAEFKAGAIPGAMNIPVDNLRSRLGDLPKNKEIVVYCRIGQRAHVASRILLQSGFRVRNLSGGYITYETVNSPQSNIGIFSNLK